MNKPAVAAAFAALLAAAIAPSIGRAQPRPGAMDETAMAENGIHKLHSQRLTLYTDLTGPEIDALPEAFDQAFPQWCAYFGVKEADHADWHVTGFLMKDKQRFVKTGLLTPEQPDFRHGFSSGVRLWLYDQPSEYYRRHLLLHEGTHVFMFSILGGCGAPWYMEGMAEYLSTHRWRDGRLTLGYMPKSREEVPEWGRVRIIQDAVAVHKPMTLRDVIDSSAESHHETASYAWRWAAATLLERHPRYRDRFLRLRGLVAQPDKFNDRFYKEFEADWQPLCEEWQLMIANLEYGYDVARNAVDFTPGSPLPSKDGEAEATVTVAADRGWQNSGLRLEVGNDYRISASGRYQVADQPKPWWCEPGGVTIRYYDGRPLGILLAAVRPDTSPTDGVSPLLRPTAIGLGTTLTPQETGTLFFKINDSPGELDDNAGELNVRVQIIRFDSAMYSAKAVRQSGIAGPPRR